MCSLVKVTVVEKNALYDVVVEVGLRLLPLCIIIIIITAYAVSMRFCMSDKPCWNFGPTMPKFVDRSF